ncbi:MAG TPA: VOC family protein [Labilithrix sp.]|jgi:catechol 2,3-dioxygenase-like lactoylglutathione lyase family enzyme
MRIHHIALRTRDLARLERFYVETLGFVVTRRQEHSVWLGAGGAILMLERADDGEPAVPKGSKELVAFAISPEEHAEYTHLVAVEARTASTIYFRDPDGRRVALSAYPDDLDD